MMRDYFTNGEVWFDENGEIKTKSQVQSEKAKEFMKLYNNYVSSNAELGVKNKLGLKYIPNKESNTRPVKEGYQFNMIHTIDMMAITKSKTLSPKEWAFIGAFAHFAKFPDNDLRIDNKYLTFEELGEMLGYSRSTIGSILKSLEENEIVKVVKGGNRPPIIYFNPFLYSGGRETTNDTYNMFVDSQYNPDSRKKKS